MMDAAEYRKRGKEMVDFIADYLENIRERRVFSDVKPGFMKQKVKECAPYEGESWPSIFKDIEATIMPGITHWQSPHMHAYYPAVHSYPSLLGNMLADALGCVGFTWASSPSCTELESLAMDWLAKMLGLPEEFFNSTNGTGGGVIQSTTSDATFISLLAARNEAIRKYRLEGNGIKMPSDLQISSRLVAYCSDQAHSSLQKGCLINQIRLRVLSSDNELRLRGAILKKAIAEDRKEGLIPFYLCGTLGTTGACAFDKLTELGPICEREDVWLHVDAAYAGTAFICPEFRYLSAGLNYSQSFVFNPSKWMLVNLDCTAFWVKNREILHRIFNVDPLYLQHKNCKTAIDYMNWQVPLSRPFRALKLWFVIRSFGIKGLQEHVRKSVHLAKTFELLVKSDPRFEIPAQRHMGLVVFKLKGKNDMTEALLMLLNQDGRTHMVPANIKGLYVIRFTVTSYQTTYDDIKRDWNIIKEMASQIMPIYQ